MAMETTLRKIGLDDNEVRIYLALLKEGPSLAGHIAEKTQIHRRTVYDALEKLIKKGLATYIIKAGKRHFQAVDPERLLLFLKEKQDNIREEEQEAKKILPELRSLFKETKTRIQAEVYAGKEGLKTVMEDILGEGKEWLSIGSTGKGAIVLPYYIPQFRKKRLKAGVKFKSIFADTPEGRERAGQYLEDGLAEVRFLPTDIKNVTTIWIYGDKTAILLVSIEQPVTFLIDNREIADSFRDYFNWLWKIAKKPGAA